MTRQSGKKSAPSKRDKIGYVKAGLLWFCQSGIKSDKSKSDKKETCQSGREQALSKRDKK